MKEKLQINTGYLKNFFTERFSHKNSAETLWFFSGQASVFILNFVIIKLVSQLGTKEFGKYSLIISILTLVGMVWYGPFTQGVTRFYYEYEKEKSSYHKFAKQVLFKTGVVLFISTLIAFILFYFFNNQSNSYLFLLAGLFIIAFKSSEFSNELLNIVRLRKENAQIQVLEKVLVVIMIFTSLLLIGLDLTKVLVYSCLVYLGFSILKIKVFNFESVPADADNTEIRKIRKDVIKFSLPFILWGFANWLQLSSDRWIIENYLSTSEVGIYSIMIAAINALISVPSTYLSNFFTPIIFSHFSQKEPERIKAGATFIKLNFAGNIVLTGIAFLVTFFFGEELILLISTSEFAVYSNLMPYFALGVGVFYIGQSLVIVGLVLNSPVKYLFPKVISGVAAIGLNFILIPKLGIEGIVYALLVSGFLHMFLIYLVNRKLLFNYRNSKI